MMRTLHGPTANRPITPIEAHSLNLIYDIIVTRQIKKYEQNSHDKSGMSLGSLSKFEKLFKHVINKGKDESMLKWWARSGWLMFCALHKAPANSTQLRHIFKK